jgi:hypothetical protein
MSGLPGWDEQLADNLLKEPGLVPIITLDERHDHEQDRGVARVDLWRCGDSDAPTIAVRHGR